MSIAVRELLLPSAETKASHAVEPNPEVTQGHEGMLLQIDDAEGVTCIAGAGDLLHRQVICSDITSFYQALHRLDYMAMLAAAQGKLQCRFKKVCLQAVCCCKWPV